MEQQNGHLHFTVWDLAAATAALAFVIWLALR
jgi:hypothetical protein